ncbi:hypothetical protein BGCPKDLD_1551 [Methylorubrum suomiense]|uniref:Uncharacterized protein n=1 Tax=Methylorubrum suomiense TaxID=144191 RepID=A0ABQ4UW97_9HYPH|nr:hypothetical protein BGCPKDLD_1551 [Methylorubrum suomiense]
MARRTYADSNKALHMVVGHGFRLEDDGRG